jgi:hypothetical protein
MRDSIKDIDTNAILKELVRVWNEQIGHGYKTILSINNYKTHKFPKGPSLTESKYYPCKECNMRYFVRNKYRYVINDDSCKDYVLRETLI